MIKAIIIDDDVTTLNGLSNAVPWSQYQVEICGLAVNGAEGLHLIGQHKPDLILTDIFMPVMDGIEMLKRVRQLGNEAEVIILSGYEDFKYAQSAVKLKVSDYLSKPATIEEIIEVLAEVTKRIRGRKEEDRKDQELRELVELHGPETKKLLLKGLLESNFCHTSFYRKACNHLNMHLDQQLFCVVLIEFAIPRDRMNVKPSDLSIFSFALRNMIEEMTSSQQEVYLADIQQNVIALIVSLPHYLRESTAKQNVKYIVTKYVDNIKRYLELEVWVATGKIVNQSEKITDSYKHALNLLAEREFIGSIWVVSDDVEKNKQKTLESRRPIELYQAITRSLIEGQEDKLTASIAKLIQTMQSNSQVSVYHIRSTVIDVFGMMLTALYDQGIFIEGMDIEIDWYQEIDRLFHLEDLHSFLTDTLGKVYQTVNERRTHKHQKTVDFMKRYVQEHYAGDITLDLIAEKVYLTRNYLSQIFKDVTGENYNNYITKVRIEKARELMYSGKYKLYEIAQMVGYKNNAYFSQQFKKYTGKNPSDF